MVDIEMPRSAGWTASIINAASFSIQRVWQWAEDFSAPKSKLLPSTPRPVSAPILLPAPEVLPPAPEARTMLPPTKARIQSIPGLQLGGVTPTMPLYPIQNPGGIPVNNDTPNADELSRTDGFRKAFADLTIIQTPPERSNLNVAVQAKEISSGSFFKGRPVAIVDGNGKHVILLGVEALSDRETLKISTRDGEKVLSMNALQAGLRQKGWSLRFLPAGKKPRIVVGQNQSAYKEAVALLAEANLAATPMPELKVLEQAAAKTETKPEKQKPAKVASQKHFSPDQMATLKSFCESTDDKYERRYIREGDIHAGIQFFNKARGLTNGFPAMIATPYGAFALTESATTDCAKLDYAMATISLSRNSEKQHPADESPERSWRNIFRRTGFEGPAHS